jgi:hypothetical protein
MIPTRISLGRVENYGETAIELEVCQRKPNPAPGSADVGPIPTYVSAPVQDNGAWATLLFNVSLLGKPRHPIPRQGLLLPCCAIGPMSPRHAALGAFA